MNAPVNSVARKINAEIVVVLGWGRAILLQLAHPLVAAGVADHTRFQSGIAGYLRRVHGTIGAMLAMTFGDGEDASAVASTINRVHDRVDGELRESAGIFPAGTRYSARDPELLRWVHATLLDSLPMAYQTFVGPLTSDEKDRYCLEAASAGSRLRIPVTLLPGNCSELDAYLTRMYASGTIAVSNTARALAQGLLSPPLGPAAAPMMRVAWLTTVGLLPPAVRDGYGFSWNAKDEQSLARAVRLVRRVRRFAPPLIREWPAARRVDRNVG